MKKLTIIQSFFLMSMLLNLGCSKKENPEPGKGILKLGVGVIITIEEADKKLKSGLSTSDFKVQIFNSSNQVVHEYANASEIPATLELIAGDYYAVASSDNNPAAIFESPYYQGNSGTFTIAEGQISTVNINCTLANIMVSVNYSTQVTTKFTGYSTTISNTSGNLVFASGETRMGFFNSGPLTIESNLTYLLGTETKTKTVTGSIANPQAGKHYEVTIDVPLNTGGSTINITLDETVTTEAVTITDSPVVTGVAYGDLLITEIMYNPAALVDNDGEWIELYNKSTKTINLKDMVIRRGAATTYHKIASDVTMAPGSYVVLGRTATATSNVSYSYNGTLSLGNTGDEIIVNTFGTNGLDGTIICSVNYGLTGFLTNLNGKSLQLDPGILDVNAAKIGSNWCAATVAYTTDLGTPGISNTACP